MNIASFFDIGIDIECNAIEVINSERGIYGVYGLAKKHKRDYKSCLDVN